jgi:hypothetical protein
MTLLRVAAPDGVPLAAPLATRIRRLYPGCGGVWGHGLGPGGERRPGPRGGQLGPRAAGHHACSLRPPNLGGLGLNPPIGRPRPRRGPENRPRDVSKEESSTGGVPTIWLLESQNSPLSRSPMDGTGAKYAPSVGEEPRTRPELRLYLCEAFPPGFRRLPAAGLAVVTMGGGRGWRIGDNVDAVLVQVLLRLLPRREALELGFREAVHL